MKRFWFAASVLLGSLSYSSFAPAQSDTGALLQQMGSASRSLNYEIHFINVSRQGIESLRYRHIIDGKDTLAELVHLDGPRRAVVQKGHEISYFESDSEPFTLSGDHIVDALPSLIFANFDRLSTYYDFIPTGRIRLADRQGDVIRVVSRDGTRFSYVVCLDSESHLPLRVDLLDQNGELLEQFRIVSLSFDDHEVQSAVKPLDSLSLPPPVNIPAGTTANFSWISEWLPAGVEEISRSQRTLPGVNGVVESRLYSDGLFSFSVNISPVGEKHPDQNALLGRKAIHTEVRNEHEITVIGELPLATARRIADNVIFKASQ
ncbi:sigma-E factor regulatory protein RseB [Musicola paradisiaca]|uniref:Sigma E regulatory protein, MucB/RseB n=1 Tax=Musicola paradisiaca (strain Ech703) TaxID=579405 RepID=C6CAR8_MUSP7|nr:sigma-E factor regulatory protein RseB [Musicola paradisiaca]ACS86566.1 sigma E regulatory protein, MucB/RseB [Musicola paradisiaca Ech703]